MKHSRLELALVLLCLAGLGSAATWIVYQSGWTLYYGDAEAHLNIARRIVDSRTPGYDQIGTVWLPLPHLLALPLVRRDDWWRSGMAGAIPSSACFVIAGVFLFAAMRRAMQSSAAALAAVAVFALNPNLLYLQATPMTEPVFLAGFMATLYFSILFRHTQSWAAAVAAGFASLTATLSRYEGWFLIPFVAIYLLWTDRQHRLLIVFLYGFIAAFGPLYWLAHNWWLYANPLEFFNGPYSAKAIYQRALDQKIARYPGDHDWAKAFLYFRAAAQMCAGWPAVILGGLGLIGIVWKRALWPVLLAALPPVFYLWSMYSGGTPIFVPELWPNTYYNTRYGLAALPLLSIAAGGVVLLSGRRFRLYFAIAVAVAALAPWLIRRSPDQWICWKESQVNSAVRRAWTSAASHRLANEYKPGTGILTSFGDLAGILRQAGIPLREALHEGNEIAWMSATARPDLFLHEEWVIAFSGDKVATAVQRATFKGHPRYDLVETVKIPGAPVIEIYKRD